jgi:hypothetical protein
MIQYGMQRKLCDAILSGSVWAAIPVRAKPHGHQYRVHHGGIASYGSCRRVSIAKPEILDFHEEVLDPWRSMAGS